MNTIQEIFRINERELASGSKASWHDQYKDSAYIHVGGLPYQLTEGDVITICSQYGEVVDISMPRDANTQKPKGFAFVMYADQRSTVLAVDNLGGAKILDRTIKVDHVLNYKQLERDNETGKTKERESQSLAAHPDKFRQVAAPEEASDADSDDSYGDIDIDDPMRDYLIEQRKAARAAGGSGKGKHGAETKEERKKRREEKRAKKAQKEAKRLGAGSGSGSGARRNESGRREETRGARRPEEDRRRERSPRRGGERDHRESDRYRRDERDSRDDGRRRDEPTRASAGAGGGARERPRADQLWGEEGGTAADSRRDERDRDDRDRRDRRDADHRDRDGDGGRGGGSFADLERWAKGR